MVRTIPEYIMDLSGAWRLWKGAQEISFMWHLWFKLKESQKSLGTSCISISTSQKVSYFSSLSPDLKDNQPIYRGVVKATYYNHGILTANSNSILHFLLYSWQKKLQQEPFRRIGNKVRAASEPKFLCISSHLPIRSWIVADRDQGKWRLIYCSWDPSH